MSEQLYKVLGEAGACHHGGKGSWDLPKDGKPGKWKSVRGELVPCERGLHVVTLKQLPAWLGPAIFEVEHQGELLDDGNKCVVRKARLIRRLDTWTERTARLFAADCAEHVLHLFERDHPDDSRPRQAIEVARRFARGEATKDELAAAWAAARDAAWDAARAAAWDAAWAAARDAARAAARDAARAAARDAARDAELQWQADRLGQYLTGELS